MVSFDDDTPFKNRSMLKQQWLKHQFTVLTWVAVIILILIAYHSFSDGDFSFLMTLGSLFVLFAFGLLVAKVVLTKKVTNISLSTLVLYSLVLASRLSSTLFYEGYLPFDKTGDWFYQAAEVLSLIIVVGLIFVVYSVNKRVNREFQMALSGNFIAKNKITIGLVLSALVIALIFHPRLNLNFFTDTAWAFSQYLEAVSLLPQVYMFQKARNVEVEPFEANFVFSVAVGRLLHLIFWLSSFHELNEHSGPFTHRYPGHLIVFSQVINLVLMADYMYYYILSAREKRGILIP